MNNRVPKLSIGLAVRNGEQTVRRCVESILNQDLEDLELVVFDNVSDDGTVSILEEFARSDRRVRVSVNEINVGIHKNMSRTLMASRGEFFRWISVDDWLEPTCLSTCVRALESREDAIGVTARFSIHTPDGSVRREAYSGEFPTSPDPSRRFARMLWFFHAGDGKYDPMYGVYRRDRLARSPRPHASERHDWLLSAELALAGPIVHVEECLAHRTRNYAIELDRTRLWRRLDPLCAEQMRTSPQMLYRELREKVLAAQLTEEQLRRCEAALRRFRAKEVVREARLTLARFRHGLLR